MATNIFLISFPGTQDGEINIQGQDNQVSKNYMLIDGD